MFNKDTLIQSLSNFYRDYGFDDAGVEFFVNLFLESYEYLAGNLNAIKRNQTLLTMETLRRYNFAVMNGHPATYDLQAVLSDSENAAVVGLSGSLSSMLSGWESVSDDLKIKLLNKLGFYISLSAKRVFDDVPPAIVDLELFDSNKNPLIRNKDYLLQDNNVYLIGGAAELSLANSTLIARNIFVDYETPQRMLGSRLGIGYSETISQSEYRDFIQMVAHVLVKGPTIKNLREAFNLLAGWENSDIVDQMSATGSRLDMWENPATAILTPFDFLVTIPARAANTVGKDDLGNLVAKDGRIDIFKSFLSIAKPTDTNFYLALSELISEIVPSNDIMSMKIDVDMSDTLPASDICSGSQSFEIEETFSPMSLLRKISYDNGSSYDGEAVYDEDSLQAAGPGVGFGDVLTLSFIQYPQYPISFSAVKDILTGQVEVTFTDNAENTDGYEIFRNDVSIAEKDSYGDLRSVSFVDTEIASLASGEYDYCAKSYYVSGETRVYSRPSKVVTIIK